MGNRLWVAVLVTVALGALMGAVNGALVSYLRIPAFIVTLAGMSAYKGLALTVPPGSPIFSLSPDLGNLFYGQVFGVPLPFFYVVGLYALATVMLNYTKFGREIYALGGNEVAARLSGVQVKWVRMLAYVAAGACTGIGGVLLAARLNSGSPNYGSGIELLAIAGAVVGGASLAGGRGHIVNTLVGTLIIVVVQNGLNLNAVSTSVQSVAIGAIILLAVALDIWRPTVSARVAELLPNPETRNHHKEVSHEMNQLGIHMMVFTGEWNPTTARDAFARAKRAGYDALEVLILDYETIDTAMTADLAAEYGLKVVAASTGTREADIGSPDPAVVRRGEDLLLRSIELAKEMGSTELGGPGFSAVARYSSAPPAGAFDQAVKSYTRVADAARAAGIRVGLEALNRYESNFINTLDQAAQVVRAAGPDALFVHADLFHMNIEERNLGEALLNGEGRPRLRAHR